LKIISLLLNCLLLLLSNQIRVGLLKVWWLFILQQR
jgi:hypothetical protein